MTGLNTYDADESHWAVWMAQAQAGDSAVYTALLRELGVAIERYLRVRFGALDVLEDCVQECLIAVHQARHTYDPERLFRPWLFTVVRHRAIDVLRRRQHWVTHSDTTGNESDAHDDGAHLLRMIDGVRVLERLAPEQREAVVLAKYAGMTTAEAAACAGISESALKARLHRGLAAIARLLELEDSRQWTEPATI